MVHMCNQPDTRECAALPAGVLAPGGARAAARGEGHHHAAPHRCPRGGDPVHTFANSVYP
jgi:hypothetical protein